MANEWQPPRSELTNILKGPHIYSEGKGYQAVSSTVTEYPKWKYRGAETTLVQNREQEDALPEGFTNSPADQPTIVAAKEVQVTSGKSDITDYIGPEKPKGKPKK